MAEYAISMPYSIWNTWGRGKTSRHFKNGISALSQISGSERKNMAKILLGCLIGIMPKEAIKAVTALLDFIYHCLHSTILLARIW